MSEARVFVGADAQPRRVRINGPAASFKLDVERIEAAAVASLAPVLEDLLEIACTVFSIDSRIKRGSEKRTGMGAAWRRHLDFTIPVRCPELWTKDEHRDALKDTIQFLTEDRVNFQFERLDIKRPLQPYLGLNASAAAFQADEVILFSGGLDSFAGALERLATSDARVVLVSHRSAQKVMPR